MNDVLWFSGRSTVGIVRVDDPYDGIKYYIGAPPHSEYSPWSEEQDKQWIADWGSRFPTNVGDILFGQDQIRNGSAVPVPLNREHAEAMVKVGMFYLEK
jgi:hypothetical protein